MHVVLARLLVLLSRCFGFLTATCIGLAGCSMMKTAPNRLVVEKRWVRDTPVETFLGGRRIHRFPPILLEKMVIVGNSIDGVVAYDRDTAHVKWRISMKDGVEGGALVAEDTLFFGAGDGQLYAVQPETGSVLWTYPLKAEGLGKPFVKSGVLYILGGNNVAHALNAKNGKLIWIYNRREASNISVRGGSQPVLDGDVVLIGFSDGALVALNKNSGSVVWETNLNHNKRFRDVDATPVIDGDTIYASSYDGALYALSRGDGKILWSLEDGGYEEVVIQGNTLFFSSTTGKTYALDKVSGKVLWSRDNPKGIATAPVIYKGTVVVGEFSGSLRFYDARTGESLSEFAPGRGVTSKATVDANKGEVYFVSHDANIYALRVNWKRFAKEWPWE
jgi:outer membrane protein assembly factor BamB